MKTTLTWVLTLLVTVACSKEGDTTDADNTTSSSIAAAMAEVSDVVGAGATGLGRVADELTRTACSTVPFSACASEVRERNFSGPNDGYCTRGTTNLARTYGKSILTFDNTSACNFDGAPASDSAPPSVARTLFNHYVQLGAGGAKLLVYTGEGTVGDKTIAAVDLKDFEGNTRSGGAVIKKPLTGAPDHKLTILGIHRRGVTVAGRYTLWHTLYSDADGITVSDGGGGDRVLNGTMYVMHNRVQRKITKTLAGVKYTAACRFPVAGTTNFTSTAGSVTVAWGSCGSATIDGVAATLENDAR